MFIFIFYTSIYDIYPILSELIVDLNFFFVFIVSRYISYTYLISFQKKILFHEIGDSLLLYQLAHFYFSFEHFHQTECLNMSFSTKQKKFFFFCRRTDLFDFVLTLNTFFFCIYFARKSS